MGVTGGEAPYAFVVIKGYKRLLFFVFSQNLNKIKWLYAIGIADLSMSIADLSKKYCRFVDEKGLNIADLSMKYCRFVEI